MTIKIMQLQKKQKEKKKSMYVDNFLYTMYSII